MSRWSSQDSKTPTKAPSKLHLISLPNECQINILAFLRAYDLTAVQQTCRFYNHPQRIHSVVSYLVDQVYSPNLCKGTDLLDGKKDSKVSPKKAAGKGCKKKGPSSGGSGDDTAGGSFGATSEATVVLYTLEDLRTIELNVVARILSLPEPKSGFYVSKSWIKKTLLWLEKVNEPAPSSALSSSSSKKMTKKQQRQRNRRLSDVSPPWPNANSDILCEHQNLQRCGAKAGRSRRKLMDKHAWKILCKLYPDSTQLDSKGGECLQCVMEAETARKTEQDRAEKEKLERKKPLANHHVRCFYTRTKGVPAQCIVANKEAFASATLSPVVASPRLPCPLVPGTYMVLPRVWCHQWRRYIKTGEGSMPLPPDSSALLCDAHKLALLPPHLVAFLRGETPQLLSSIRQELTSLDGNFTVPFAGFPAPSPPPAVPVGVRVPTLDVNMINALMATGMSQSELALQREVMLQIQGEQGQQAIAPPVVAMAAGLAQAPPPDHQSSRRESVANNDLLDRENHMVCELVTQEEWTALVDTGCWPKQVSNFCISVNVEDRFKFGFSTLPCRDCDPSGLRFMANASCTSSTKTLKSPKFRTKRWEPKHVEQKRIPNVEY